VPKADVLISGVYQYRPGPELSANLTVTSRGNGTPLTTGTALVNLLHSGPMYGDSVSQLDLKLAKVFRFAGARANVGVDVYNVFNSDAITSYKHLHAGSVAHADRAAAPALRAVEHAARFLAGPASNVQGLASPQCQLARAPRGRAVLNGATGSVT
jgi:hypothetical protein